MPKLLPSRRRARSLALLALIALAACDTAPETYPLSGEACGSDDPVQDMRPSDCQPLPGL